MFIFTQNQSTVIKKITLQFIISFLTTKKKKEKNKKLERKRKGEKEDKEDLHVYFCRKILRQRMHRLSMRKSTRIVEILLKSVQLSFRSAEKEQKKKTKKKKKKKERKMFQRKSCTPLNRIMRMTNEIT